MKRDSELVPVSKSTVEDRLQALERSLRFWRTALVVVLLTCAAFACIGMAEVGARESIAAKEFVLVNEAGERIALFARDGGGKPGLWIYQGGKPVAVMIGNAGGLPSFFGRTFTAQDESLRVVAGFHRKANGSGACLILNQQEVVSLPRNATNRTETTLTTTGGPTLDQR